MAEEKTEKLSHSKQIAKEARDNFKLCAEAETEPRKGWLDDLEFLDGKQWPDKALRERELDGRPALVVNRMDQFVQHITNGIMQQRIAGRVFPVDDVADPDTADVLQGHIRHIEYDSDADLAYNTGAFYATAIGRGCWRVVTKFCNPMSFDVELRIERVRNPFQAYWDPYHDHPTGKDARFGFYITRLSEEEYKADHPESELSKSSDWTSIGDLEDWIGDDRTVRIAEYYKIETTKDTLVRLADGTARLKSELPEGFDETLIALHPKTGEKMERQTELPVVKWYKTDGNEILEESVWPTSPDYVSIPLVKVIGNELDVNGKLKLKGIIRNLKDAQRQYNFMLSAQTEAVDSSKGQVVIEAGQIEGHEEEWEDASKKKVLQITGKNLHGGPAKDPYRLPPNASIQSMTEARLMAADDLKALTGIYDAALGAQSNETSGIAIRGRQAQSDTANFHFTGNLVRSINHTCRILLGAIPIVIDTPRSIRIVGKDQEHKVVKVNEAYMEGDQEKNYKVSAGKYDVVCEAGPNPRTKQEQDSQMMTELVKVAPGLMEVAPDLILKAIGAPQDLVDRVRPPQFQQQDGNTPLPPQVQQQVAQLQDENQQLTAALNQASQDAESKKAELESRERMNTENNEVKIYIADQAAQHTAAMALMSTEFQKIHDALGHTRSLEMQANAPEPEAPQAGA